MNAGSITTALDVQRTLQYQSHVFTRKLIWMPIVCLAIGMWVLLYGSPTDKMQWQPWLGLFLGAGWLIYAFYRLAVPAPPMLVLSPEGLIWRNGFDRLIPWSSIRDVTGADHAVWFRGTKQTIENVTIVWVSRRFYNQKIFVRSLILRGPFWSNAFVHRDDVTGIVIAPEMISVAPEALRAEIVARWHAFGPRRTAVSSHEGSARSAGPRTSVPSTRDDADAVRRPVELADDVEARTPQYWLNRLAIVLAPVAFSAVVYLLVSSYYRTEQAPLISSRAGEPTSESVGNPLWRKPDWNADEVRLAWREQSPWMFSDDDSFTAPGTMPPQRAGSTRGHRASVTALSPAGFGRFLSASEDGTIKLWTLQERAPLRDVGLHGGGVRAIRLLPGGAQLLSGGDDGQVVLRALADGKVLHRFDAREHGGVRSLAVTADGRRALSLHTKGGVLVWDLETRVLARRLDKETGAIAADMSQDGTLAAIGTHDGKLLAWLIDSTEAPRQIGAQSLGVFAAAILPDGRRVVSAGGEDFAVQLRDVASGAVIRSFPGHKAVVDTLALAADGRHFVSGSGDRSARLWDLETGEQTAVLDQSNSVRAAAFAADGTILTAGEDRSIRLWSRQGFREREFPGAREN